MHLNPKKLKHSKWTAVQPQNKEKHFIVIRLIMPKLALTNVDAKPNTQIIDKINIEINEVELQAVYSGRSFILQWRDLMNSSQWLQGWL